MKKIKKNKEKFIPQNEKITFGLHSGKKIKDLPTNYIKWGYENFTSKELHVWRYYFGEELVRRKITLTPKPNTLENIGINKWNKNLR
jgi:hypothetical protein